MVGDALEKLRELPDESVHCCVTSPPYWGLRDYGTAEWEGGGTECDHLAGPAVSKSSTLDGGKQPDVSMPFNGDCGKCGEKRIDSQLGLEKTPEEYVAKMVEVFREVRRALRKDGTLWLNLGDSYYNYRPGKGQRVTPQTLQSSNGSSDFADCARRGNKQDGLKEKDLIGIPWRVALALQADGWWLRQDIIWNKPNPMPESVTDRCTKSHEYLFLLTKSARYFYDAEAIKERGVIEAGTLGAKGSEERFGMNGVNARPPEYKLYDGQRNKRSVWTVATASYPEAHFATYPPDLIKPCIMAGTSAKGCCAKCGAPWERIIERIDSGRTQKNADGWDCGPGAHSTIHRNGRSKGETNVPVMESKTTGWKPTCSHITYLKDNFAEGGSQIIEDDSAYLNIPCTVLDPFAGSGTTGAVALELGRKAILIELNLKYAELIKDRCNVTMGLALA